VPFFFKQWGGVRKCETGRELDGKTYDGFPELVHRPIPASAIRQAAIGEIDALYRKGLYHVRTVRGARAIAG
jgi:hypothetical protein